jgi:PAS domain S-box-containing protein
MRILIADDHEIIRRELRSLLSGRKGWEVCGEAVDGLDAVEKANTLKPDVIVMDISMPNADGLQAARTIHQSLPAIEVLFLSQHDSDEIIRQALKTGAKGYVLKSSISRDLVNAVEAASRHEFFSADSALKASNRPSMLDTQGILLREAALERALRESEELFRWTFEQAAVGMVHASPDGRFLRVNQKLCDILGYSREEILKFGLKDLTHPDDLAATMDHMSKLRANELNSFSLLKRYINKNGTTVWATTTVSMVRDSRGTAEYVMAVINDITERKQAEAALHENIAQTMMRLELAQFDLRRKEELLRVALAASDTGTFRWDSATGELLEFEEDAKRLFGFAPGESITNSEQLLSRVHPDDLSTVRSAAERCRAGGDLEIENRVILPDGNIRWLYARGKVTPDARGRPYVVGAATDITKRKEAEEAAGQSDANRKFVLEAARLGDWELDLETQRVKRSLRHDQIFGYTTLLPEWTVDTFLQHAHPDDRESVHAIIQKSMAGESDLDFECRIIRADQDVRWIWARGALHKNPAGTPVRMLGTVMDVTERKKTEEALRKSVFRFQRFVESNVIGVVISDADHIIETNDVFLDMAGYTRDDLFADKTSWAELTHPDDRPRDLQAIEELESFGACSPFEKDLMRKDGTRAPILIGASVLNPSPLEWMSFVVDLSALKKVERELREARDDLDRRVQVRTRELVNTLSNLEAEVRVRKDAEEKMRELSARLLHLQDDERRRIARDLHDTVGQTLSAMRMTSDALRKAVELNPKAQGLFEDLEVLGNQALEEIRATSHLLHPPLLDEIGFASAARWFVEGLAKRSRIEIDLDIRLPERIPGALELALFRVLQESLTNIHRHSGSSGAAITCEQVQNRVILTVRDHGKGIPADALERFQKTGVGTGIGLVGMRERVRELGGRLEIESDSSGTTLTVTIPLTASAGLPQTSAASG